MQITLMQIKNTSSILFLISLLTSIYSQASPKFANGSNLKMLQDELKDPSDHIKYIFVDEKTQWRYSSQSSGKHTSYILDITKNAPVKLIYSYEIDRLFKDEFFVEIDQESIIETPNADFLVLRMSRPHEYNPKSIRCAPGMGEDRTYLATIKNGNLTILNRKFLGCAADYKVIRNDSEIGYEVTDFSSNPDDAHKTKYILKNGKLIKQVNSK